MTTAAAFGSLTLAHVARVIAEGRHVLGEPVFLLTTVASIGLFAWACVLVRKLNRLGRASGQRVKDRLV